MFYPLILLLTLFSQAIFAADLPPTYVLDLAKSKIEFKAGTWISSETGHFTKWNVTAQAADDAKTHGNATVQIDVASIATNNKKLDKHLLEEDFFWVEKYPYIRFVGSGIRKAGAKEGQVSGELEIRGTKRHVQFPVSLQESVENEKIVFHVQGALQVQREDFGLNYHSPFPFPDIKNKVEISFDVWLKPVPASSQQLQKSPRPT